MYNNKNDIERTLELVFSSTRRMPAHFTSEGERSQTFAVDFEPLTADDDCNMASTSYNAVENFAKGLKSTLERSIVVKFGEDLMLGGYVYTKLGGAMEQEVELFKHIAGEDKRMFENGSSDIDFDEILESKGVGDYLKYCFEFGVELAKGATSPTRIGF